jgi:hypothetical protein
MDHPILLTHLSYNNNQVGTINVSVKAKDRLVFSAHGADFKVVLIISSGGYNQPNITVRDNQTVYINILDEPDGPDLFEATCQACLTELSDAEENGINIPPIEAPKRIVVIRAGMTVDMLRTTIENKLKKINQLQIYLGDIKERIINN